MNEKNRLIPQTYTAFCFFPTKEVTGLNFIIHAPFLLTDSREGIRASEQHNMEMIDFLANLAAKSLICLRDIGQSKNAALIDDDIFDIVPYDDESFTDIESKKTISFKPFYTRIIETFTSKAIISSL